MYIRSIKIKNIRSIKELRMDFEPEGCAGWHVLIGDNGSGKSSVAKAIALGLIGIEEAPALREEWNTWLRQKTKRGHVELSLLHDNNIGDFSCGMALEKTNAGVKPLRVKGLSGGKTIGDPEEIMQNIPKIFSVSYGPFRRFKGGSKEYDKLKKSYSRILPHLSLFGEDFALSDGLEWIKKIRFQQLEKKKEGEVFPLLKKLINKGELLPGGAKFWEANSDGVVFRDPNGCELDVSELSDGYRSILSLTFDLIRQMVEFYDYNEVFQNINTKKMVIDVPGVVIIDEIDAHLHPTWQKRIGYWLTKYFPEIQFIVTTHSPLVCYAAENGTVWRLASPGSNQKSGKVTGTDLKRLLYGNIIEALDTELFGQDVIRSETSVKKLKRMEELNNLSLEGEISESEEQELQELRAAMPTSINAGIKRGGVR